MTQCAKYECFPGDVTIFHSIHYCIVTLPLPQPITFHRSHCVYAYSLISSQTTEKVQEMAFRRLQGQTHSGHS